MDTFLKKHFWIVNLTVIAICASLAGRAGAHYVEHIVLMKGDEAPAPRRDPAAPAKEPARSKSIDAILERNIFCSTCPPSRAKPEATASKDQRSGLQKSNLQLELVSTMVVMSDERWSMAVIRDLSTKDHEPRLYARHSQLAGGQAMLVRVVEKRVYLRNQGRLEYLELDGAAVELQARNGTPARPGSDPHQKDPNPTGQPSDPLDSAIGSRVRCNGTQCDIERGLVDQLLLNTTALATAARIAPAVKDGRPSGFKLSQIRPSSIVGRLGLQNGDTVKAVNGMEMNSPDQALGVYTKVRSASHLTITVDRRGEMVTLDYTIR